MALIRPRLTDFHGVHLAQEDVDFAIPFLDEDLPFGVDPFFLWRSPSQQENALHGALIDSFNHLGQLVDGKHADKAVHTLICASECPEVGLGFSATRQGARIGMQLARKILSLFSQIPQVKESGFRHLEEVQLLVEQISRDRISDFTCSFLKSFLIDYTMEQCTRHGIPVTDVKVQSVYDQRHHVVVPEEDAALPVNPETSEPILLVPKRWLRKVPWISPDDYMAGYFLDKVLQENEQCPTRGEILLFNRQNYGVVQAYVREKEKSQADCHSDPLFKPIPILSAKRKFATIKQLPTGKDDRADRKYEDLMSQLMASLMYPDLDFAAEQSRTDSGVSIRDLLFYNNRSVDFLDDVYRSYDARQIVMELKNVRAIERSHINQLNRYLTSDFGRFGVFLTRSRLPRAMFRNTVDLWAGQRRCIIALTDEDVALMVDVFDTKQRKPIDVLKKKYVEFTRACPA